MTNYLNHSFKIILTLFLSILLLSIVPEKYYETLNIKKPNILADLNLINTQNKSLIKQQIVFQDTCKQGITCLEDYSDTQEAKNKFFSALLDLKNKEISKVRIAFFGDSYIDGDIVTSDLRDTLQAIFGGNGVGFVPICSETNFFRQTVRHTYKNFESNTILTPNAHAASLATGGYCFIPKQGNYLRYEGVKYSPRLMLFNDIKIFYRSSNNYTANYQTKEGKGTFNLVGDNSIHQATLHNQHTNDISFTFPSSEDIKLYGVSLEDSTGIYLDNFAMKSNSGLALAKINNQNHQQFDSLQHYQCVFLQYGLNIASANAKNFTAYEKEMSKIIDTYKKNYPKAAIIIVGISDRSSRQNGTYQTMPSIPYMIDAQRAIARNNKIIFWNLFEAMGGQNSMVDLVNAKPALANKDYTHLKFNGGKKIAHILLSSILYEFEKYQNKIEINTHNTHL